jgi:hypothetical protein
VKVAVARPLSRAKVAKEKKSAARVLCCFVGTDLKFWNPLLDVFPYVCVVGVLAVLERLCREL